MWEMATTSRLFRADNDLVFAAIFVVAIIAALAA